MSIPPWLRSVSGVVAGVLSGVVIVMITDMIARALFPLPAGTDLTDRGAVLSAISGMPVAAFIVLITGWVAAAFVATLVAIKVSRGGVVHGYVAGMLLFASTMLNLFLVPHPTWVLPITAALVPVTVWLATRVASPPVRAAAQP
jgi:hypothetical protein